MEIAFVVLTSTNFAWYDFFKISKIVLSKQGRKNKTKLEQNYCFKSLCLSASLSARVAEPKKQIVCFLLQYGFCIKLFHYECTFYKLNISSHKVRMREQTIHYNMFFFSMNNMLMYWIFPHSNFGD